MQHFSLSLATTLLSFLGASPSAAPGPLQAQSSPAGPATIAATAISLDTEPRVPIGPATTPGDADSLFRISKAGSYYLPRNLAGVAGKAGIEIAASNVSIDLSGFTLSGGPGTLSGIRATGGLRTQVAVVDGVLRDWGEHGVDLSSAEAIALERLRAEANGSHGFLLGDGASASACTARSNTLSGFRVGPAAHLRDCMALYSGNHGFDLRGAGLLSGCLGAGSSYSGFFFARGVAADNCTARSNEDYGFIALEGSVVVGCTATDNGTGFQIAGSHARACTATDNGSFGIDVEDESSLVENIVERNGFSGIQVSGHRNRIDGNHVTGHIAGTGIWVVADENHVVRNTSLGNMIGFSISSGNGVGTILSLSAGPISTSNPWSNWSD